MCAIPMNRNNSLGWVSKRNPNTDMVRNAEMSTKDSTPYDQN